MIAEAARLVRLHAVEPVGDFLQRVDDQVLRTLVSYVWMTNRGVTSC